jgi:hypothetical protein
MTCIIVKPIWVNDVSGEESFMYDELGTPAFYMISGILQKHLGEDNIWVSLDYNNTELFTINYNYKDVNVDDSGFITINEDKLNKDIEKIKNIYELHTLVLIYKEHMPSTHIKFEIIDVCVYVSADVDETKPSETKTDEIKSK